MDGDTRHALGQSYQLNILYMARPDRTFKIKLGSTANVTEGYQAGNYLAWGPLAPTEQCPSGQ